MTAGRLRRLHPGVHVGCLLRPCHCMPLQVACPCPPVFTRSFRVPLKQGSFCAACLQGSIKLLMRCRDLLPVGGLVGTCLNKNTYKCKPYNLKAGGTLAAVQAASCSPGGQECAGPACLGQVCRGCSRRETRGHCLARSLPWLPASSALQSRKCHCALPSLRTATVRTAPLAVAASRWSLAWRPAAPRAGTP